MSPSSRDRRHVALLADRRQPADRAARELYEAAASVQREAGKLTARGAHITRLSPHGAIALQAVGTQSTPPGSRPRHVPELESQSAVVLPPTRQSAFVTHPR
jgi:hypothetical protein